MTDTERQVSRDAVKKEYQERLDRIQALREQVAEQLSGSLVSNPALAEELNSQIDALVEAATKADARRDMPAGPGPGRAGRRSARMRRKNFGETLTIPQGVAPYDEHVNSERIVAVGDLYYIYQHEQIGVFRVVQKLKQLFEAGAVRLSAGPGAYGLYQFDRRDVLRYTRATAWPPTAACSATAAASASGSEPPEHRLPHAVRALRQPGHAVLARQADLRRDPRAGAGPELRLHRRRPPGRPRPAQQPEVHLLRSPQRAAGRGHAAARGVLQDPRVRQMSSDLFGADNAWDVVDEVLIRYFDERLQSSPRQRMAVTGREVLRWLSGPHIMETGRGEFEALLMEIAEPAEEWLTSAQAMSSGPAYRQRPVSALGAVGSPASPRRSPSAAR